jgi:hypothetical protein
MSAERRYDYCKIYVSGAAGRGELRDFVAELLNGQLEDEHVVGLADDALIEVLNNPDLGYGPRDDFLFWPYLIEFDGPDWSPERVVQVLSKLLGGLKRAAFSAVPSCEFEDELLSQSPDGP